MPDPLVSIGLPVYNGARFVAQAIESLLGQSYRNVELIISDNASTDETAEICRRIAARDDRVRYSRLDENVGGVPNANRVFALATGTYFMWAADDDLWLPNYVESCVRCLEADPSVVLVFSRMAMIDEGGTIRRHVDIPHAADSRRPAERFREFTAINAISEAVYGVSRADAVRATPLYVLHPGHDKIFLAELALRGRFVRLPDYLYQRREHDRRSVRAYPSLRDRYAWLSPSLAGKRVYPHWAYLRGYASAVARVPLRAEERAACAVVLLRWIKYHWKDLAGDLKP